MTRARCALLWLFAAACAAPQSRSAPAPAPPRPTASAAPTAPTGPAAASVAELVIDASALSMRERLQPLGPGGVRGAPWTLAFAPGGKTLVAPDEGGVIEWDVAAERVARRLRTPPSGVAVRGIFRAAHDVFVMAGEVYRVTDQGLVATGSRTYYGGPKSFVRKDASTVVCVIDAGEVCQAHFVLSPGQTAIPDPLWGILFPLGPSRGFAEGPYRGGHEDLGTVRIATAPPGATRPLLEILSHDVELHFAVPSEDGGLVLVWEGAPGSQVARLRRVSARGLGPACSLGTRRRPSPSASMSISPDGRLAAIPLFDTLLVVDIDACRGKTVKLPALAVGTDFAPDSRSIAVGLEDGSIAVID